MNKPIGKSSHDVVAHVRRTLFPKGTPKSERFKVGHAGTLDPFASGVLLVMLGKATRLESYLHRHTKIYTATIQLGRSTTTDDPEGETLEEAALPELPLREALETQLQSTFLGEQEQLPPVFSAIKQGGVAAYKHARAGKNVQRAPRTVTIHSLSVNAVRPKTGELIITTEVGTGTYIRALGRDIGEHLGTKAHLTSLTRTNIGPFSLEQAIAPEQLTAPETIERALLPLSGEYIGTPEQTVTEEEWEHLRHGRTISTKQNESTTIAFHKGKAVAILTTKQNKQWPNILLQTEKSLDKK